MKRLMTIFGAILVASFFMTSCNDANQDQKELASKDSLQNYVLQAKSDSSAKQNSIDSPIKRASIDEILGVYTSNESFKQDDLRGDKERMKNPLPNIAFETVSIKQENGQIIINQNYISDPGPIEGGCDGSFYLKANAELIDIEKLEAGVFRLQLKKLDCNYYTGTNPCSEKPINIKENTPTSNSEFSLTINAKNISKIIIEATAEKTKCEGAWDFSKYTFFKGPGLN